MSKASKLFGMVGLKLILRNKDPQQILGWAVTGCFSKAKSCNELELPAYRLQAQQPFSELCHALRLSKKREGFIHFSIIV